MNIKGMRNVHLYLGCFFAPLLALFIVTGCWQMFDIHHASKDGSYKPAPVIKSLSGVHTDQRWSDQNLEPPSSGSFRTLVIFMSLGILVTTILGIIMAFKYTKPWIVWACLGSGTLLPAFLLWMGRGFQ